jgi:predicted metalloendopeptidase
MRWSLLNRASSQLSTILKMQTLSFTENLNGAVSQRPRDERALQTINGTVGEALGKLYVEKNFRLRPKPKQKK